MLKSPGVSCLHQELALFVPIPLGVLAGGVAVHLVVIVPALHSWDVLHVMMSAMFVGFLSTHLTSHLETSQV